MVKYAGIAFLMIVSFEREGFTQIHSAAPDSIESIHGIYDPSQISNEIFLRTDEVTLSDELQFLSDDIERIASHRILLSTATWKELQQIPTLTDLDISTILRNRKDGSPLSNEIKGDTKIFLRKNASSPDLHIVFRSSVVLDPDAYKEAVYQSGSYEGSPVKTVSRFVAKNNDILFSLVEAKNPGEPLYFDHLTGCFALVHALPVTDDVSVSKLVLGDYSLSFGSGLLFTSGYGQISTKKVNLNAEPHSGGIQPYISSSSYRYFRGAASEVTSGIFSLSGFFSDRTIDATVSSTSDTITSLSTTGYHRTASELAKRNQAQSNVAGAHVSVTPVSGANFLEFGATAYQLNYDKFVAAKDSTSLGFSGQRHSMISADMRGAFNIISWSTEYARMISDAGYGNAFVATMIAAPLTFLELSLNYRNLPQKFISPFGGTFGINSATAQNETGFYLGSKVVVVPDQFWFFSSANISQSLNTLGNTLHYSDILLGSEYTYGILRLAVQLRSYGKGPVFSITGDSLSKNSFRFDAEAELSKTISASFRGELQRSYSAVSNAPKGGYLLGVGLYYLPTEEFSVSSGMAFFGTDSYASRFYSNEADLPGSVPFVALYGSGYRYYVQCSYDPINALTLSARIGETRYTASPGSPPLHKTTIGVQCDVAF